MSSIIAEFAWSIAIDTHSPQSCFMSTILGYGS